MSKRRWFSVWNHVLWPVAAAWLAYSGGWFAVGVVVLYVAGEIVGDRLIYWQRELIESKKAEGMVRVSIPGRPSVYVPETADAAAALARLVAIVEGDDRP